MNSDILEGKWKQMKGEVQNRWGKITDDDFAKIQGNRERFAGVVQERYGKNKEQAKKEVNEYIDSL